MVKVPGVFESNRYVVYGSGSDGVDIGDGSIGCGSFDAGDDILIYDDSPCPTAAESGVDHKHWFVIFRKPTSEESPRKETIKLSLRLLAQVVGKERALISLYRVNDRGFGCQVSEEEARKFWDVDEVKVENDSFIQHEGIYRPGVYWSPEGKFPGPDDDLCEYRKYLDDWEAEHGGRVFFPHNQLPAPFLSSSASFSRSLRYTRQYIHMMQRDIVNSL